MPKLNNRNYNRKHGIYYRDLPREPTPPLPIEVPLERPDAVNIADDPDLEWYNGEDAGGMKMNYGQKYYNKAINEIPLGYLTWCQTEASYVPAHILNAIQNYKDGLKDWLEDGNYGKFVIPFGKTYKGMSLEKCRDKEWVRWMIGFIEGKPNLKAQHGIFLWVLYKWLDTIRPQNVKRDIGRRIRDDNFGYNSEADDSMEDADENGNLKDFVVDDEEGEDGDDTSGGEEEGAGSDDDSNDYTGEISDSELEDILEGDAQHGLSASDDPAAQESQESSDEDYHPILPPQTPSPSKRMRRRLVLTDDEDDEDEGERTPRVARNATKRNLVHTSPFDSRRVNKRLRSCQ